MKGAFCDNKQPGTETPFIAVSCHRQHVHERGIFYDSKQPGTESLFLAVCLL